MEFVLLFMMGVAGWTCVALAFEHGMPYVERMVGRHLSKHEACKVYWVALGVITFICGDLTLLVSGIPVAISHINLARHSRLTIGWRAIFVNMYEMGRAWSDQAFRSKTR